MKKTSILVPVCLLATGIALTSCSSKQPAKQYAGIDRANFDTTVSPGENFFQYANGSWLKANPIPADQVRWGSFGILAEDNKKHLKEIAEDAGQQLQN